MYICIDRHTDTKRPFAMERTQRSKELIGDTATAKALVTLRSKIDRFYTVVRPVPKLRKLGFPLPR